MRSRTPIPKAEAVARYNAGSTTHELAKFYGRSQSTMWSNLKRWDAKLRPSENEVKFVIDQKEMVRLYKAGATLKQLGKQYGCTYQTICRRLIRAGVKRRRGGPERTYKLDEHFFDVVDTEEKAYWLGFMLADGCVRQTKNGGWSISVALASVDHEHLEKLAKALKTDAPITRTTQLNQRLDGRTCLDKVSRLVIWSAVLAKALIQLECFPRKSCVHGTPEIPEELRHHFYRGAYDGDGSGSKEKKKNRWQFSVVGSPMFVADYQQWLMVNAHVAQTKLNKKGAIVALQYGGGKQMQRILELLYRDATVKLDRKFEVFQRLKQRSTQKGNPFDLPVKEIVAAYRAGISIRELSRKYGCCYDAIWSRLKQLKEPLRPRPRRAGPLAGKIIVTVGRKPNT